MNTERAKRTSKTAIPRPQKQIAGKARASSRQLRMQGEFEEWNRTGPYASAPIDRKHCCRDCNWSWR